MLLVFSATLFFANSLFAQETTSDIVGTVTENGKAIAGATITALHNPSGTKYVTTSRNDGRFNLPNMKVGGPYTITVSFIGYREEKKQENITLLLGQEFKADFKLTPEAQTLENVVVTSSGQKQNFQQQPYRHAGNYWQKPVRKTANNQQVVAGLY